MYILNVRDLIGSSIKKNKVIEYLSKHKINNIEEEILKNMSFIYYNDEVLATLSYELYCNIALIRCFVYTKDLEFLNLKKLFKSVGLNLKEKGYNFMISFSDVLEEEVFLSLGFKHIDESKVYIEEENFLDSKYKNKKTYLLAL